MAGGDHASYTSALPAAAALEGCPCSIAAESRWPATMGPHTKRSAYFDSPVLDRSGQLLVTDVQRTWSARGRAGVGIHAGTRALQRPKPTSQWCHGCSNVRCRPRAYLYHVS